MDLNLFQPEPGRYQVRLNLILNAIQQDYFSAPKGVQAM